MRSHWINLSLWGQENIVTEEPDPDGLPCCKVGGGILQREKILGII